MQLGELRRQKRNDAHNKVQETCWGLVLKCYELRTRQHKMLNVNVLRPLKHYFLEDLMNSHRLYKIMLNIKH
jgi:hypothetical protein